jgi:ribosomal protein S18 acetylase RimI-like enzyme
MPLRPDIPIRVRPLAAADLHELYAIDKACFPAGIAYSRAELRWVLSLPGSFGFAAEINAPGESGEPVIAGFIIAGQEIKAEGRIITIDVLAGFRRLSLGRLLMGIAEEHFIKKKADRIRLEVAAGNTGAQEFYRALGYESAGRIQGYYPTGEDALVMRKSIRANAGSDRTDE